MMKKCITFISVFIILALLSVCFYRKEFKPQDITLLGEEWETGGGYLYEYRDGRVILRNLRDQEWQELLELIRTASVRSVELDSTADLQMPIYGIGTPLQSEGLAYWDGYWFDEAGNVYELDLDFEQILTGYSWGNEWEAAGRVLPCSYALALYDGDWDPRLLEEVVELDAEGFELEVIDIEGTWLHVRFSNPTEESLTYGYPYSIQVKQGDKWYYFPTIWDESYFALGITLHADESVDIGCDLSAWGNLPPGTYRMEKCGAIAEFTWNGTAVRLPAADHAGQREREDILLTAEYPVYPLGTERFYAVLANQSGTELSYATLVEIEHMVDGQWRSLSQSWRAENKQDASPEPSEVAAGIEVSLYGEVSDYYWDFGEGQYRLVVSYELAGSEEQYMACTEFEIRRGALAERRSSLESQSRNRWVAVRDGCLVVEKGQVRNPEVWNEFLHKVQLQIPCELRIVDRDRELVKDICFKPVETELWGDFLVETLEQGEITAEKFAFLDVLQEGNQTKILFSSFGDAGWALRESEYFFDWDLDVVMAVEEESKWLAETVTYLKEKREERIQQLGQETQVVSNLRAIYWLCQQYTDEYLLTLLTKGSLDREMAIYSEKNYGTDYRPLYLFPVGDRDIGAVYRLYGGKYAGHLFQGVSSHLTRQDSQETFEEAMADLLE